MDRYRFQVRVISRGMQLGRKLAIASKARYEVESQVLDASNTSRRQRPTCGRVSLDPWTPFPQNRKPNSVYRTTSDCKFPRSRCLMHRIALAPTASSILVRGTQRTRYFNPWEDSSLKDAQRMTVNQFRIIDSWFLIEEIINWCLFLFQNNS